MKIDLFKIRVFFCAILLSGILFSCKRKNIFQSEKDLISFLKKPENGYTGNTHLGEVQVQVTYRPKDLILNQFYAQGELMERDSIREQLENYFYFIATFSVKGNGVLEYSANSKEQFGKGLKDLAFNLKNHISFLTSENKDVEIVDYSYPRTYGYGNKTTVLVVLSKKDVSPEAEKLMAVLRNFWFAPNKTGEISFNIENLYNEPQLKLFEK